MSRVLSWFSCGEASAVASKLAVEQYGERCEVLYCDTFAFEHPDNRRFLADCEKWMGREIKILRSEEYRDIYDVFDKTGWLIGPKGARCTTELKKNVRKEYQQVDDVHVFGFTTDEQQRVDRFYAENPDLFVNFPLIGAGISKANCRARVRAAGIEIPAMYRLGYKNNNCIGCVKGGKGYWNKIRVDFPEAFARMAAQERKMGKNGIAINHDEYRDERGKRVKVPVFLDELPPDAGRYVAEPDIECGVLCIHAEAT